MVYNNNSLENICAYFGKHRENICHKQTLYGAQNETYIED